MYFLSVLNHPPLAFGFLAVLPSKYSLHLEPTNSQPQLYFIFVQFLFLDIFIS